MFRPHHLYLQVKFPVERRTHDWQERVIGG